MSPFYEENKRPICQELQKLLVYIPHEIPTSVQLVNSVYTTARCVTQAAPAAEGQRLRRWWLLRLRSLLLAWPTPVLEEDNRFSRMQWRDRAKKRTQPQNPSLIFMFPVSPTVSHAKSHHGASIYIYASDTRLNYPQACVRDEATADYVPYPGQRWVSLLVMRYTGGRARPRTTPRRKSATTKFISPKLNSI